jgi:hypothetical protein
MTQLRFSLCLVVAFFSTSLCYGAAPFWCWGYVEQISKKTTTTPIDTFMKFYKSRDATPEKIQNFAAKMVRQVAISESASVLTIFLIELDMIKPPNLLRDPRLYLKYGEFKPFNILTEFYKNDGSLDFPEGISVENEIVLKAQIAQQLAYNSNREIKWVTFTYDKLTELFLELIESVKVPDSQVALARAKEVPEPLRSQLLTKKRLAAAVVIAYVELLNFDGGEFRANKVLVQKELEKAIRTLPYLESYQAELFQKMEKQSGM